MSLKAIDANILLRFLTADHPEMSPRCRALLERVEQSEEELFLPAAALQDTVWTLQSFYKWPRERIVSFATQLLSLDGLIMRDKAIFITAIHIFGDVNIDFSDAVIAAEMRAQGIEEIYSFDRDFERLDRLVRMEP